MFGQMRIFPSERRFAAIARMGWAINQHAANASIDHRLGCACCPRTTSSPGTLKRIRLTCRLSLCRSCHIAHTAARFTFYANPITSQAYFETVCKRATFHVKQSDNHTLSVVSRIPARIINAARNTRGAIVSRETRFRTFLQLGAESGYRWVKATPKLLTIVKITPFRRTVCAGTRIVKSVDNWSNCPESRTSSRSSDPALNC